MTYEIVDPTAQDALPNRACETRPICGSKKDASRFENLGIRFYVVNPGDQIPQGLHYHETQEEGFYVISGVLYIETPERTYDVNKGYLFLAEAGSPHRAFNPKDANQSAQVLAMGAPTSDPGRLYDAANGL